MTVDRSTAGVLSLAAAALVACHKPGEPKEQPMPEVQLFGVHLSSFKGAEPVARGTAAHMAYERASADVTCINAHLGLLKPPPPGIEALPVELPAAAYLQAPVVVGNLITHGIDGSGGVALDALNGTHATTDRAHFDANTLIAQGRYPVRVESPTYSLRAAGFVLDLRADEYDFDGPVESQLGGNP